MQTFYFQEKASMFAMTMGHDDFAASNGWLTCWQERYNVKWSSVERLGCGSSRGRVSRGV